MFWILNSEYREGFLKIYVISVSVISVSVSADMKKLISVFYRYRPIRKFHISGFIGIGQYEKKPIGRTLTDGCISNEKLMYF